jgi:alanine racemase
MPPDSPTALIDLDALVWNYGFLRDQSAPAETGAVVKADAYGLGMAPIAEALHRAGCKTFFTAHFSEALALRAALKNVTIVTMHGIPESAQAEAVARNITPVINYLSALESWSRFARLSGKSLPAFIHLDTGMNRLGLPPTEQKKLSEKSSLLEGITVKAWMSHFACSDEFNNSLTTQQRDRLKQTVSTLPKAPVCLCNSSGIFWGKDYVFDLTRPGVALYGGNPTLHKPNPMRAVLELQAPILQVRDVDTGMTVGYGATHRFTRKGRVATLALGYADGYHRALENRGTVMIGSHPAPLIGRISMDLITLDITDVPEAAAHPGAMATLIGPHRTLDAVAAEAGTIAYEILTSLGARITRIYNGKEAS